MAKKAKEWRNLLTKGQLDYIEGCLSVNEAYGAGKVHKVSAAVETVVSLVDILDGKLSAPKEEIVEAFDVDTVVADFDEQLGIHEVDDEPGTSEDFGG